MAATKIEREDSACSSCFYFQDCPDKNPLVQECYHQISVADYWDMMDNDDYVPHVVYPKEP